MSIDKNLKVVLIGLLALVVVLAVGFMALGAGSSDDATDESQKSDTSTTMSGSEAESASHEAIAAESFCEQISEVGDAFGAEKVEAIDGSNSGFGSQVITCNWSVAIPIIKSQPDGPTKDQSVIYVDVYPSEDAFQKWEEIQTQLGDFEPYEGTDFTANKIDDNRIAVKSDKGWALLIDPSYFDARQSGDDQNVVLTSTQINSVASTINDAINNYY